MVNDIKKYNELVIFANEDADKEKVKVVYEKLKINIVTDEKDIKESKLVLKFDSNGISLIGNNMILHGDFNQMIKRIKKDKLKTELLIRASKIKNKTEGLKALDATAGMGEDSLLLAAYGFEVDLYEKNPIIALLLQDTIERAMKIPELENIVKKMKVIQTDSIQAMKKLKSSPDVILLDPMFPKRTKSAMVKKKFQLLHELEDPCIEEEELLNTAIFAKPNKIIIKRPLKGPWLADVKPNYSIKGNSIRYDCIVIPN